MITISKKVEYSIELMSFLTKKHGKIVSLMEASKILHLPYRFLGQVAIDLRKGGIIEGKEGKSGGYLLMKDWKDKSLYDLLEALGENKGMVKCLGGGEKCIRENGCKMRNIWQKLEENFLNDLKKIKLCEI
ncbi:MAG: Rrf2 family transcriptional regulator [Candidatus Shapirobacteria bacterium]